MPVLKVLDRSTKIKTTIQRGSKKKETAELLSLDHRLSTLKSNLNVQGKTRILQFNWHYPDIKGKGWLPPHPI